MNNYYIVDLTAYYQWLYWERIRILHSLGFAINDAFYRPYWYFAVEQYRTPIQFATVNFHRFDVVNNPYLTNDCRYTMSSGGTNGSNGALMPTNTPNMLLQEGVYNSNTNVKLFPLIDLMYKVQLKFYRNFDIRKVQFCNYCYQFIVNVCKEHNITTVPDRTSGPWSTHFFRVCVDNYCYMECPMFKLTSCANCIAAANINQKNQCAQCYPFNTEYDLIFLAALNDI